MSLPTRPTPLRSRAVAESLKSEEAFIANRRDFHDKLKTAEDTEISCVDKRIVDEQHAAQCIAEEREQTRRAAEAEAIAVRAAEEHRLRVAEFQAAQERLAAAEEALQRASAADDRAQKTREIEAQAAQQKSAEARRAEGELMQSRASEDKAIQEHNALEASHHHLVEPLVTHGAIGGPVMPGLPGHPPAGNMYSRYGYGSRYLM